MPFTLAIGLGAAGAVGNVAGSVIQGNAQKEAGQATLEATKLQLDYAKDATEKQRQDRDTAVGYAKTFGGMSADEYSSISKITSTAGQALQSSLASIRKQQAQLDAADPSVKAAGSNLLDLLQGKASSMLAPVQAQLSQQRSALVSQLASTLGPGYATSSAGIQALLQFDQQSALTQSNIQLNAVNQATQTYGSLFGAQLSGQASIGGQTQSAFGADQSANEYVFGANNSVQNRLDNSVLSAFSGNSPNYGLPVQTQGQVAQASGLPFAGANSFGGSISGLGTGLGQVSGQVFGQASQDANYQKYLDSSKSTSMGLPLNVPQVPTYNSTFLTGKAA